MKEGKITIFLSHSHKDEDKIRKIRDLLETLDCEPLIFFLKCLDDDNTQLEDFIKKEIEARNVFIYCKSKNSENSEWVQKELDYIKSFDKSRLYVVDIENDFQLGMINILTELTKIIKKNRLFVSYNQKDKSTAKRIIGFMKKKDVAVFNKSDDQILTNLNYGIEDDIKRCADEGKVIILLSENSLNSEYTKKEIISALDHGADVIPVMIKSDVEKNIMPFYLKNYRFFEINAKPTIRQLEELYRIFIKE